MLPMPPRALVHPSVCFVMLAFAPPAAPAQATLVEMSGTFAGDTFGHAVADAGDVNADGFDDYIVAAKLELVSGVPVGAAHVFSGLDGSTLHSVAGTTFAEWFGWSVSRAGDLDNDGHDDFFVGAPHDDTAIADGGAAHVYSGATGLPLYSWYGDGYQGWFGYSVADAGDVDNDGFPDLVAGAWRDGKNGADSGTARVFSGLNGALLHEWFGDAAGDELGFSVAGAGDTNADGHDDVIVATLDIDVQVLDGGGARLFSGKDGTILHQFYGDSTADWYGYAVRGVGDLDGDGHDDVIVGAPRDDNNGDDSGMVRAFSGFDHSLLLQVDGPVKSQFGWSLDGLGDLNGDGVPDLIVGLPRRQSYAGEARLLSGADGSVVASFFPSSPGYYGYSVSAAGDANGNGTTDVLVGAPFDDTSGQNAGRAELLTPICGSATTYSTGCPGEGGFVPRVVVSGCPTTANRIDIGIEEALGGSTAFLFFGSGQAPFALGGGCALDLAPVAPAVATLPLGGVGAGNGSVTLHPMIPAGFPPPYSVNLAAVVIDPSAAGGYSTTGGVTLEVR
ncbi:MAG: integrin alpha [Planctomycetota bacterium JB042]